MPATPQLPPNLPPPPAARLSTLRIVLAFAVALVADSLSFFFNTVPPVEWGIDLFAALALFLILGARWPLLPALICEAIPGVAMLPTWLIVVAWIAFDTRALPPANPPRGDEPQAM